MTETRSKPYMALAVDHRFPHLDAERRVLAGIGAQLLDGNTLAEAEFEAALTTADAILLGARFRFDRDRLARMNRCQVIVRYGIGVDNVDLEAAAELGIRVSNVPEYCSEEVTLHTVSLILALHRQLLTLRAATQAGLWQIPPGTYVQRISETSAGVVGFGRIGREVAAALKGLGYRVLAHDPFLPTGTMSAAGVEPLPLAELLSRSDVVTLHLPLSPDTRRLISAESLRTMKPGAILVNVSRGGLVDHAALYEALVSGHLAGAGLDVTDPEPPEANNPLLSLPNVIVTPHAAWFSRGALLDLQRMAAEEAARVLAGQPQSWPVGRP